MIRHTTGIICAAINEQQAKHLQLPLMVPNNTDPNQTAFTVSVDHRDCSTGVSASDRSKTVQALANSKLVASDFRRPGTNFALSFSSGPVNLI